MSAPPGPSRDGPPGDGPDERERGLARERTDMAWTRTAIAFAATGAAILKNHVIAGIVVLALGLVTWGMRRLFPATVDDGSRPRRLLLVTITVTLVGLIALGVALTAHSPGIR
jgi:uncharacterized membrane protein YidH (DUF202 family)